MSLINLGLVGCGAASKRYYLPALLKNKNKFKNIFFVDKNIDLANEMKNEVGIGETFSDYKDILGKVDGVIIVLPHFLHHPVSMDFLNSKSHVLCEKPLAESAENVKEMIAAAELNEVSLSVNNTRRMFPVHREVKRLIEANEIGKVKSISFVEGSVFGWASATGFYVDPGISSKGILLDVGPHDVDLVCWWLGDKPELLSCKDDSFGGPESVVNISAKTSSGIEVEFFLNRLSDLDSHFKVEGELGVIEGRPMDWNSLKIIDKQGAVRHKYLNSDEKNYPQFVLPIMDNFLKVIIGDATPVVSGKDVLDSIEFIDECYARRERLSLPELDEVEKKPSQSQGITLVTGATGFVGCRIVEMLYLSGNRNVRAGIHQWSSAARLGRFPVDIVLMDLMNPQEIQGALEGVTEIIHCAKGPGDVNRDGTKNLLEAALNKGVKHFVHLSTAEIYGDATGLVTEEFPFKFTGNEYNKTKIEAEKVCWDFVEKGLPITIFRPSIIYGPFSKNWSVKFANMFIQGDWGVFEKYGEGKCNLVYVDDLVKAIVHALDLPEKSKGQAFNICGPEVVTWNEYFSKLNDAMALPPLKKIESSSAKLKTAAMQPIRALGSLVKNHFMGPVKKIAETFSLADKMMRKIEHSLKTTPSPDELLLFNKDVVYKSNKIVNFLDYEPKVNLNKGLENTTNWFKNQKIIQ